MTTVVGIQNLPVGAEASVVWTLFDEEEKASIKEIYTHPCGQDGRAWVIFPTEESAEKMATKYQGQGLGPTKQKLDMSLLSLFSVPGTATSTLSGFLREEEHATQLESRTVKVTNLPASQTLRSLKALFEATMQAFDCHEPDDDDDDPYHASYEPPEILHLKSPSPGTGLIQLAQPSMALQIIREFHGTYWAKRTLHLTRVPDAEMQRLLSQPGDADGKPVQLFVTGIPPGASAADVRALFADYTIRDVNVPPGGKTFCFVFVKEEDAGAILALCAGGYKVKGRTIRASLSEKGKKKKEKGKNSGSVNDTASVSASMSTTSSTPTSPSPSSATSISIPDTNSTYSTYSTPETQTTDLKVDHLPYRVSNTVIRGLFEGFGVTKIVARQGYAYVGVAACEAERAVREVNGRRVGDMNVLVRVAGRGGGGGGGGKWT